MIKDLFKLLKDVSISIEKCPISPKDFSTLINLITKGDITDKIARTLLEEIFYKGGIPEAIIEEKGLKPIQDTDVLAKILDEVVAEHSNVVSKITKGETRPIDFLIGQVMKKTRGRADPKKVRELTLTLHKSLVQKR